jgi:hypothetical protein
MSQNASPNDAEGRQKIWLDAYNALPKERQQRMQDWFAGQSMIIEALGLSDDEWFEHVQWSIEHPLDYSFLYEIADAVDEGGDALVGERNDHASRFLGQETAQGPIEQGPTMAERADNGGALDKELFQRFVQSQLGGRRQNKGAKR